MRRVRDMIAKVLDTLKGKSLADAAKRNEMTAKSLKDELAEARAKADADIIAKERVAHAAAGKE